MIYKFEHVSSSKKKIYYRHLSIDIVDVVFPPTLLMNSISVTDSTFVVNYLQSKKNINDDNKQQRYGKSFLKCIRSKWCTDLWVVKNLYFYKIFNKKLVKYLSQPLFSFHFTKNFIGRCCSPSIFFEFKLRKIS